MKHVKPLTVNSPAKGELWQDVVCGVAAVVVALLDAFSSGSPFANFIDGKCLIPTPNDPTN